MTEVSQFIIAVAFLVNVIFSIISFFMTRRVEKNTNSMKDALVKVTGESEHAKGMLQGAEDERNKK